VEPTRFGEPQPTPDPQFDAPPVYIEDYTTGTDAISVIDETSLKLIADQLGVQYLHRTPESGIESAVTGISVGELRVEEGEPETTTELYWIFAIPLGILALLQFVALSGLIAELRSARRPT
jgi:Ca-activated chloride channel family protein